MRSFLLYFIFVLHVAAIVASTPTQKLESLLKKANEAFEHGRYGAAESLYDSLHQALQENEAHKNAVIQLSTHPAHSYSLQGWVYFRLGDAHWRARFHNGSVDSSTLRKTRQRFEAQIQSMESADPANNDLIASIYESLGDTFWCVPPAADIDKAWRSYEKSLQYWGSSIHLDEAQKHYFSILRKASLPSGSKQQLVILIPKAYFENAVKIARTAEETGFSYWGLAKAYAQEDISADIHTLAGLHFEKAIEYGADAPWLGKALFDYAEWAEKGGGLNIDGRVRVPVEPNLELAEILYARALEHLTPDTSAYLWAQNALKRLQKGSLQIIVPHEIPAQTPFEFQFKGYQIDEVEFALYLLDVANDIDFNQYALTHALMEDNTHSKLHDPSKQWLSAIKTEGKKPFSIFTHKIDPALYNPENATSLTWPSILPIGMYLLEARAKDQIEKHSFLVGDLRLVASTTNNTFWVYAYENLTQEPAANATVTLNTWSSAGEDDPGVWTKQVAKTDASGKALFSIAPGMEAKAYVMTAQNQAGKTAFVVDPNLSWSTASHNVEIKSICDRKAYQAGETANWKFYVDHNMGNKHTALHTPLYYTIRDPLENLIQKGPVVLGSLPYVEGSLEIKSAFLQGPYCITIQNAAGKPISEKKFLFTVEKFRQAEVEVSFEIQNENRHHPTDIFSPGEDILFKITTKSKAGATLDGNLVQLKVYQAPFAAHDNPPIGQIVESQTLQTNDYGEVFFTFTPPYHPSDCLYTFVLDFPGLDKTEVTFHKKIGVTQDPYRAKLTALTPAAEPHQAIGISLSTTDLWNRPLARSGTLQIFKKSDPEEPLFTIPLSTNKDGRGAYELNLKDANLYELVWIDDELLEALTVITPLWVIPKGSHSTDIDVDFDLHAPETLPYSTKKFSAILTLPETCGTILITTTKDELCHWARIIPTHNVYHLEIPLPEDWSPEIIIEVIWIDNNHLQSIQRAIKVSDLLENYKIEWTWDKDSYYPNEDALLTLKLTENGNPVQDAEVTLAIDNLQDVTYFSPFVSQRSLRIRPTEPITSKVTTSIQALEQDASSSKVLFFPQEKFLHIQEPSPLLSGEEKWIRTLRHKPQTIYWNNHLKTDYEGTLRIPVKTSNRIHDWSGNALVHCKNNCFSLSLPPLKMNAAVTSKMLAPDFLVEGDVWEFYIEIYNKLSINSLIKLDLKIQGAELLDSSEKDHIKLSEDSKPGIQRHKFTLKTLDKDFISIDGYFQTQDYTEAVAIHRPIHLLQEKKNKYTCLTTTHNSITYSQNIAHANCYFLRDWSTFFDETTLSQESLHRLSIDSIASQLIIDLFVYDWLQQDRRSSSLDERLIRAQKGMKKILKFQNRDGGWPWWAGGVSDLELTAHMTALLTLASQLKVIDFPEKCLQQARSYLENALQILADSTAKSPSGKNTNLYEGITISRQDHNNLLESLIFWALTCQYINCEQHLKRQEIDLFSKLWKKRDQLSFIGLCALTLGALQSGFEEEAVLLSHRLDRAIDSHSIKEPVLTFYPKKDPYYTLGDQAGFALLSTLKSTLESSDSQLCALNTLLQERQGLDWEFPRTTALAIVSIYQYLKRNPIKESNSLSILLDDAPCVLPEIGPLKIEADPFVKTSLRVERNSGSLPLIVWKETTETQPLNTQAIQNELLVLERYYDHIWLQPSLLEGFIEYKKRLETFDGVRTGDQIEVVLLIEVRDPMTHLLIKDPLPAGFECVYPSSFDPLEAKGVLSSQVQLLRNGTKTGLKPIYTNKKRNVLQVKDEEHIVSAIDQLSPGFWEISYRLRAEACGRFKALPAVIQAEYNPSCWAQTAAQELFVHD